MPTQVAETVRGLLAGGRAVDALLLVGAKTPQLLATLIALPVLLDLDLQLTCCSVSSEKKHDHVILTFQLAPDGSGGTANRLDLVELHSGALS
jgi:hypothetical protein